MKANSTEIHIPYCKYKFSNVILGDSLTREAKNAWVLNYLISIHYFYFSIKYNVLNLIVRTFVRRSVYSKCHIFLISFLSMFEQGEENTPRVSFNGELDGLTPINRINSFVDNNNPNVLNTWSNNVQDRHIPFPVMVSSEDQSQLTTPTSYTSNNVYNPFLVQSISTVSSQFDMSDNPADHAVPSSLSTSTNSQFDSAAYDDSILIVAHPSPDDTFTPEGSSTCLSVRSNV